MNASTVDNTIKINVAITLAICMKNFFLKVITASSLCCSCPCHIPVCINEKKTKAILKVLFFLTKWSCESVSERNYSTWMRVFVPESVSQSLK